MITKENFHLLLPFSLSLKIHFSCFKKRKKGNISSEQNPVDDTSWGIESVMWCFFVLPFCWKVRSYRSKESTDV